MRIEEGEEPSDQVVIEKINKEYRSRSDSRMMIKPTVMFPELEAEAFLEIVKRPGIYFDLTHTMTILEHPNIISSNLFREISEILNRNSDPYFIANFLDCQKMICWEASHLNCEIPVNNNSSFVFHSSSSFGSVIISCPFSNSRAIVNFPNDHVDYLLNIATGGILHILDLEKSYITGSTVAAVMSYLFQQLSYDFEGYLLANYPWYKTAYPEGTSFDEKRSIRTRMIESASTVHFTVEGDRLIANGVSNGVPIVFHLEKGGTDVDIIVDVNDPDELDEIARKHHESIKKAWPMCEMNKTIRPSGSCYYTVSCPSMECYFRGFRDVQIYMAGKATALQRIVTHHVPPVRAWRGKDRGIYFTSSALRSYTSGVITHLNYTAGEKTPADLCLKWTTRGYQLVAEIHGLIDIHLRHMMEQSIMNNVPVTLHAYRRPDPYISFIIGKANSFMCMNVKKPKKGDDSPCEILSITEWCLYQSRKAISYNSRQMQILRNSSMESRYDLRIRSNGFSEFSYFLIPFAIYVQSRMDISQFRELIEKFREIRLTHRDVYSNVGRDGIDNIIGLMSAVLTHAGLTPVTTDEIFDRRILNMVREREDEVNLAVQHGGFFERFMRFNIEPRHDEVDEHDDLEGF